MASQNVAIYNLPLELTESVAAHTFVDLGGGTAEAGGYAMGVALCNGEPGDVIGVDVLGTAQVVAGGALAVGDAVQVGNAGRAVRETEEGLRVGRALQASAVAGDMVEILLIQS